MQLKSIFFVVGFFTRKKIYCKCIWSIISKYPQGFIPIGSCVWKLVRKWWIVGSLCNKKRQFEGYVLTEEDIIHPDMTGEQLLYMVKTLGTRHCVWLWSAFTATKLIEFCLYEVIVMHQIELPSYATKIIFSTFCSVRDGIVDP